MDPISIASAVWGALKEAKMIYDEVQRWRSADEVQPRLASQVLEVQAQLQWVHGQFMDVAQGKTYSQRLLRLYQKKSTWVDGKQHVSWEPGLPIAEMIKLLPSMLKKLVQPPSGAAPEAKAAGSTDPKEKRSMKLRFAPVKNFFSHQSTKVVRRTRFYFSQAELEKDTATLDRLMGHIDRAINQANFETTRHIDDTTTHIDDTTRHTDETTSKLLLAADLDRQQKDIQARQEDYSKVLQWLSPLSFHDVFQDATDSSSGPAMPSEWFFEKQVFRAWEQGKPWRLSVFGEAGSGKTVLASHVVSYLQRKYPRGSNTAVLYLFLKYEDRAAQSVEALLASLLKQCVIHHGHMDVPVGLRDECFAEMDQGSTRAKREFIERHLQRELFEVFDRTFIVIDGLDEAGDDMTRKSLLQCVKEYIKQGYSTPSSGKVSLLSTSRRLEDQLRLDFRICDGCKEEGMDVFYTCKAHKLHGEKYCLCQDCALSGKHCSKAPHELEEPYKKLGVTLEAPSGTIEKYVEQLLAHDLGMGDGSRKSVISTASEFADDDAEEVTPLVKMLRKDKELGPDIVGQIAKQARGRYMLARMLWSHVRDVESEAEIYDELEQLPDDLNTSFDLSMDRINKETAKNAILWVSQVSRPMSVKEIQFAMSVKFKKHRTRSATTKEQDGDDDNDGDELEKFNPRRLIDIDTIFSGARGLLVRGLDDSVRLVHRTAAEYLQDPMVRKKRFPDAQEYMAKVCLTTLSYAQLEGGLLPSENEIEQIGRRLQELPFAAYAAQNWGFHTQACQTVPEVSWLLRRFLDTKWNVISAVQISAFMEEKYPSGWGNVRKNVNPLHVAAWFGLESTFDRLCKTYALEGPDSTGFARTPLIYAARGGHPAAVQKLLDMGADPMKRDKNAPPLVWAASLGHSEVVGVLVKHPQVDVNVTTAHGRTSLMHAAQKGRARVIRALVEHPDVDVNLLDQDNFTALHIAAARDSSDTMEALLDAPGIDIEKLGGNEESALIQAASQGRKRNVHLLLQRHADPACKDKDGGTALRRAIDNGHNAVVEVFEKAGFLHNDATEDKLGKNLLFSAAISGSDVIVQFLLRHGFPVNSRANDGGTALHDAVEMNKPDTIRSQVIKVLLRNNADTTIANNNGQTAADLARERGDWALLDLIEPPLPGVSSKHDEEGLPATSLARRGSDKILEIKAQDSNFEILKPDVATGQTALAIAIHNRHVKSARIILKAFAARKASIDIPDRFNTTPLHEAAGSGDSELVKLMVSHDPPPNLDRIDVRGATALSNAVNVPDVESINMLLAAGAKIDPRVKLPVEALTKAIEDGDVAVAEKLIFADVPIHPFEHRTLARKTGNAEMIRLVDTHKTKVDRSGTGQAIRLKPAVVPQQVDEGEETDLIITQPQGDMKEPKGPDMSKRKFESRNAQSDSQETSGPDMSKAKFKSREEPIAA